MLNGCLAYSYVDERNVQHVIGLVNLAIQPPETAGAAKTASAINLVGLGVSVLAGASGHSVTLGYSSETLLLIPDSACIDLQAPGPCASSVAANKESP